MFRFKVGQIVKSLLLVLAVGTAVELVAPQDAEARAGRGRSFGRSPSRQAPPPSSQYSRQNQPPQQPLGMNQGMNQMNQNRGGFMRGLAGGIAGGFLGSMLFSSLGHAAGGVGGLGGAGGAGGIGFLEIILIAGLAYFGLRWWKNRQQMVPAYAGTAHRQGGAMDFTQNSSKSLGSSSYDFGQMRALAPAGIEADAASDIFFKVQGAWTRRDLTSARDVIGSEMQAVFEQDLAELKQKKQTNRLENISVRNVDVTRSWEEEGSEYSTVRFTANLLDYTVDDDTGRVVDGSDSLPVKFEEDWMFAKASNSSSWKLVGIEQV